MGKLELDVRVASLPLSALVVGALKVKLGIDCPSFDCELSDVTIVVVAVVVTVGTVGADAVLGATDGVSEIICNVLGTFGSLFAASASFS